MKWSQKGVTGSDIILYPFNSTISNSKFVFKSLETNKHRLNIQQIRGYSNNVYIRWLGYPHKNQSITYDSILKPSFSIHFNPHFKNAIRFMTSIHFILPFGDDTQGIKQGLGIWKWMFQAIKTFSKSKWNIDVDGSIQVSKLAEMKLKEAVGKWIKNTDEKEEMTFWSHSKNSDPGYLLISLSFWCI